MSWILLLSLLGTVLSLFIPLLMGQFITDVCHGSLTLLLPLAICAMVALLADQASNMGSIRMKARWDVASRVSLTEHILSDATDDVLSSPGEIISRLNTDVHMVIQGLFGMFTKAITAAVTLILLLVVSAGVSWILSCLLGFWAFVNLVLTLGFRTPLQNMQKQTRNASARTMGWSTELFQTPHSLMTLGRPAVQCAGKESGTIWGHYANCSARESIWSSVLSHVRELMRLATMLTLIAATVWMHGAHAIPLADTIGFILLVNRVHSPVETLVSLPVGIAQMQVSADRLLPYLLNQPVSLPTGAGMCSDAVNVQSLRIQAGAQTLLRSVDLHLPRTGVFLIIGANGTGKSLLVQTLLGLRPPAAGSVVWYAHASLAKVGYVPQFVPVYPATLFDNVALGRNVSEKDVKEALTAVGLSTWQNLHVPLAARGLSGGERKRVGLARALVGRPAVIVCDELEAGLDDPEPLIRVAQAAAPLVLAVTHHRELWPRCDGMMTICDGRLELDASLTDASMPAQRFGSG